LLDCLKREEQRFRDGGLGRENYQTYEQQSGNNSASANKRFHYSGLLSDIGLPFSALRESVLSYDSTFGPKELRATSAEVGGLHP
jgi:hypothetical protein